MPGNFECKREQPAEKLSSSGAEQENDERACSGGTGRRGWLWSRHARIFNRCEVGRGFHVGLILTMLLACWLGIGAQTPSPSPPALNAKLPTVFVVGDSTANNNANGGRGWGDPFVSYFDPARINVLNRARAGRSSRTYITEGFWEKVLRDIEPGDFVLIQFGHNDGGPLDTGRARGSLPGTGEETQEVVKFGEPNLVVHTYGWYMRRLINDAKSKGATPIVLSLTVRNIWKDGRVERGSGKFGLWAKEIATSQRVAFIDLTTIVADRYEALGQDSVKELFATDHTHTSPKGAELNAASVITGLKALPKDPLKKFFSAKGNAVHKARLLSSP
ncbi:MAG: rhamnogalacturonan acetylesterase [Pyrinomonadaceae bacterium]|nr:rhamnogalacturonan acetylesterase [Pyrinomonadaceae bacterium]